MVLEREGGPRQEGSAITFWPNAFRVLDALGVAAPIRDTHALVERCAFVIMRCEDILAQFLSDQLWGLAAQKHGALQIVCCKE